MRKMLKKSGFQLVLALIMMMPFTSFSDIMMNNEEVKILHLAKTPSHIYIGNHEIADVNMLNEKALMLKSRAFGETQLIIMDKDGNLIRKEKIMVVHNKKPKTVSVYLGTNKQTYSCIQKCAPYGKKEDAKTPLNAYKNISK